jgi:hypothetical protein
MNINNFKLCYFKDNFAYFTSDFENQTGDDWNDAPFDSNAGTPYDDKTIVFKIALYGDFSSAQDHQYARPTSVDRINTGFLPWLDNGWNSDTTWTIHGGITYLEFLKHCDKHNLNYYVCQKEINETIIKINHFNKQTYLNFED